MYVVGEAGHPEVEATLAHVPGATAIDSVSEVEARAREFQDARRVGLVVQTTMSAARLREVVGAHEGIADPLLEDIIGAQEGARARAEEAVAQEGWK